MNRYHQNKVREARATFIEILGEQVYKDKGSKVGGAQADLVNVIKELDFIIEVYCQDSPTPSVS